MKRVVLSVTKTAAVQTPLMQRDRQELRAA